MAPFVKVGEIFEALCADAEDRPKFYASMGLNFEKIIGDALAAARRDGAEAAVVKLKVEAVAEARDAALEEAARVCIGSGAIVAEARLCAAAIRALKDKG